MNSEEKSNRLATTLIKQAQMEYKGLWPHISEDIRRDLCLAQAARWCSGQDDTSLPLSKIVPTIDLILTSTSI